MRTLVLGSGIIGLWTADILSRGGHDVVIVSKSGYHHTTTASAACVLNPTFPGDPTTEAFQRNVRWALETLEHMESRELSAPLLESIPCYEFGAGGMLEDNFPLSNLRYLQHTGFTVIDLESSVAGCDLAVRFECRLCDAEVFLPRLVQSLIERGVMFRRRNLRSLSEIHDSDADVVFNCLGYQTIFPDPELYPVFGQSMFVPAAGPSGAGFGLGSGDHAVYAHSGGYYIGSYFLPEIGQVPRADLYHRSLEFVKGEFIELCACIGIEPPAIDLGNIQRVNAGIRPFRSSGPLLQLDRSGTKTIVHNYGHGAHGWTTGYASALDSTILAGLS